MPVYHVHFHHAIFLNTSGLPVIEEWSPKSDTYFLWIMSVSYKTYGNIDFAMLVNVITTMRAMLFYHFIRISNNSSCE